MTEEKKKIRGKETIQRQIYKNVLKGLTEQANRDYEEAKAKAIGEENVEYKSPTEDEIKAECKKRWQQHLDRKEAKKDVSSYFA